MFEELPEPVVATLTHEENSNRRHQFAIVLNFFVLAYNALHKFIMPLYICFSANNGKGYLMMIDWWWLYHVALALLLFRKKWDDAKLHFALFVGIGGVLFELVGSVQEYNWVLMSFWITAFSTLSIIIYIFSISHPLEKMKHPFLLGITGLLLGIGLQIGLTYAPLLATTTLDQTTHDKNQLSEAPLLDVTTHCGWSNFSIKINNGHLLLPKLSTTSLVSVKECGFLHNMAQFNTHEELILSNHSDSYLNIKVVAYFEGKWKNVNNVPLRNKTEYILDGPEIQHDILIIFSDSDPKMGIMVLLNQEKDPVEILESALSEEVLSQNHAITVSRYGISPSNFTK